MLHLSTTQQYYLCCQPVDFRKGFDSLCGIITSEMNMNALSGSVFIFFNKKRSQIKLLLWEGDGLSLYHKRLEKGTFELPRITPGAASSSISQQQLQFILQGVSLQKVQYRQRYKMVV